MRAHELLLEYDRQTTISRLGAALVQRYDKDRLDNPFSDNVANLIFDITIMAPYDSEEQFSSLPEEKKISIIANAVLVHIERRVPAKYVPWATRLYITGGINNIEDFGKLGEFIKKHMALRASGYFKRNPEANNLYGDLFKFKTLSDLGEFIISIRQEESISNNEKDRQYEKKLFDSKEATLVYDDAEFKIVIPHTEEASIFFGKNTQWCTAATESENLFDHYNDDGPLYIVLNKKQNKRWQLHFQTNQFMDENDRHCTLEPVTKFIENGVLPYRVEGFSTSSHIMMMKGYPVSKIETILKNATTDQIIYVLRMLLPKYCDNCVGSDFKDERNLAEIQKQAKKFKVKFTESILPHGSTRKSFKEMTDVLLALNENDDLYEYNAVFDYRGLIGSFSTTSEKPSLLSNGKYEMLIFERGSPRDSKLIALFSQSSNPLVNRDTLDDIRIRALAHDKEIEKNNPTLSNLLKDAYEYFIENAPPKR